MSDCRLIAVVAMFLWSGCVASQVNSVIPGPMAFRHVLLHDILDHVSDRSGIAIVQAGGLDEVKDLAVDLDLVDAPLEHILDEICRALRKDYGLRCRWYTSGEGKSIKVVIELLPAGLTP